MRVYKRSENYFWMTLNCSTVSSHSNLVDSSAPSVSRGGPRLASASRRTSSVEVRCPGPGLRSHPGRGTPVYQPRRWDDCQWPAAVESCPAGRCWVERQSELEWWCLNSDEQWTLVFPDDRFDQFLHRCGISPHHLQAPVIMTTVTYI